MPPVDAVVLITELLPVFPVRFGGVSHTLSGALSASRKMSATLNICETSCPKFANEMVVRSGSMPLEYDREEQTASLEGF